MQTAENWALEAAKLPVAFAQTREDAAIDLTLLKDLKIAADVIMIASGGCTSAALAGCGLVGSLHLVDFNPSQMALARYKLDLLQKATVPERLKLLGHRPMLSTLRRSAIVDFLERHELPPSSFGSLDFVAEVGLDFCGRFERLFKELSTRLSKGKPFDSCFAEVMSLANLVALFGREATKNPVMPFDRHFADRSFRALTELSARNNPYLEQVLWNGFRHERYFPWLGMPPPAVLPKITCTVGSMQEILEQNRHSYDLVHLSNILDWLEPQAAEATMAAAYEALRPGGLVVVRQLNSSIDVRACGEQFHWLEEKSARALIKDRSFFYRAIHIGQRNALPIGDSKSRRQKEEQPCRRS